MNSRQFTYTLNTDEKKMDEDPDYHQFYMDFGGLGTSYDHFQCQCTGFSCNVNDMVTPPLYISVSVENLAEEYYSNQLSSNECVLATILTTTNGGGILDSSQCTIFNCSNLKQKKRLRFSLRGEDLALLTTVTAPHNTIYIQLELLLTPIA